MSYTTRRPFSTRSFAVILDSLMQDDQLPLSEVVNEQQFADAFEEHGVDFGREEGAIFTPAITLWGLISQVFFSQEQRSTTAAVMRIGLLLAALGRSACSPNNGAYCKARLKINYEVVRTIATRIAEDAERFVLEGEPAESPQPPQDAPQNLATVQATPVTGRLILVDGFTVTAADTAANQAEYPQNPSQDDGLGFPILRCVCLISLSTGMLIDLEAAAYCGKETGETALLWKLLKVLRPGDVLIADSYYCTYWLLAACRRRGVHVVMRNHHRRDNAPAKAKRISRYQRIATWERPAQPEWMTDEEYAEMPASVPVRLVDVHLDKPGIRTEKFTVATTILDSRLYTRAWITAAYGGRWVVELDIRSIKCALGMDILRAKTPAMVRTELWSCLLAYNLIRQKILANAVATGRSPRSLSFTTTLQLLGASWLVCASIGLTEALLEFSRQAVHSRRVGHRPGRIEPRANKRRPKYLALLTQPRAKAVEHLTAVV